MLLPPRTAVKLDYAMPGANRSKSRFRLGAVSLSLASIGIFACVIDLVLGEGFKLPGVIYNAILTGAIVLDVLALAFGVGGLFQSDGRLAAVAGIFGSIIGFILIPALNVA